MTASDLNRHLFVVDNYRLLRGLPTGSIDLITTDPPFAKNGTFVGKLKPPLTDEEIAGERALLASWGVNSAAEAAAAGVEWPTGRETAQFKDIWSWESDVHEDWIEGLLDTHPHIAFLIDNIRTIHSDGTAAYIAWMAVRLIECHRVLKPTGSLYLHCDPTANGYLRMLLDGIFGHARFQNEITWRRTNAHPLSIRKYEAITDTLLYYTAGADFTFNGARTPLTDQQIQALYSHSDKRGRFASTDLTGGKQGGPDAYRPFKGVSPSGGRAWAPPSLSKFPDWAQALLGSTYDDLAPLEKCHALDEVGLVHWTRTGRPRLKRHIEDEPTQTVPNLWADIPPTGKNEQTGYPTQKPWALAERIIAASSNKGDVVLDPFAGCAYTAVAAEGLGRQWIACDISPRALTVLRRQFAKKGWAIDGEAAVGEDGQQNLAFVEVAARGPGDVPERDDSTDPIPSVRPLPKRTYKRKSADMPRTEMLELLARVSGWACWACGFAVRNGAGEVVETGVHFHLDHIEARAAGGSHHIHNRAVLCSPCNTEKGQRPIRLKDLRRDPSVQKRRTDYGVAESDLCDIDQVQEAALIEWSAWRAQQGLDQPTLALA